MKTKIAANLFDTLVCSSCNKLYPADRIQSFATCCQKPLLATYHLDAYAKEELIDACDTTMWRYFSLLPVIDRKHIVSLGEGMTPMLSLKNLSEKKGISIWIKDEGYNPTGSFKARGISVAVSRAKALGIDKLIIPTAGNAGGALAAYCAKGGMKCIVVMLDHTPAVFKNECQLYGAEVILVKGLIDDCARKVEEIKKTKDHFDVSTLKEPYRLEGKKTMGYELAEQFNWQLPGVIIYPAGGGTGLIGIWKAFREMLTLGWIKAPLPRMMAVQPENCAPLVAAIKNSNGWKESFSAKPSVASGLAVPFPFGMDLMRQVIDASGGEVVTVTEKEIIDGVSEVAQAEGVLLSPEGGAAWKAIEKLSQNGSVQRDQTVLFLNTGSGYKYIESLRTVL
ncbi:MAG TPA: threonine synthase [Flavisolibacter sp.]|nr:threonine synthase [Flavisolibacter sp.]